MKNYYLCVLLALCHSAFYHLASNYGQVIKDLSGDGNHGVNGELLGVDNADTFPTDRGAYFTSNTYIKLPSNPKVSSPITMVTPFSLYAWVFALSDRGTLFLRIKDSNNYFHIMRGYWYSCLSFRIFANGFDSGIVDGTYYEFPYKAWKLVLVTFSGNQILGYMDKVMNLQYTLTQNYLETGGYEFYIGKTTSYYSGDLGIIYYAGIKNEIVSPDTLIGPSSSTCLLSGCSSCTRSIIDPVLSITGCAASEINEKKNSNGNSCSPTCSTNNVGCNNSGACMLCSCSFFSCTSISGVPYCLCSDVATATQTTCICPNGYYYLDGDCLKCLDSCFNCNSGVSCSACLATNSVLSLSGLCGCSMGYYAENQYMNTTDSCKQCNTECATCSEASLCLSCISSNASPNPLGGCKCNEGYYGTGLIYSDSCSRCYTGCQICTEAFKCITCTDPNAIPSVNIGCVCKDGFYFSSSSNTCVVCHSDCFTCNEANICLTCKDSNSQVSLTLGCDCKEKFYLLSEICESCLESCSSCNNGQTCINCIDVNAEVDKVGACKCKVGYYNESGSCVICPLDCASCDSASQCLSCKDLNGDIQKLCACKDGMYFDTMRVCLTCDSSCLTCSSSSSCLTCSDANAEIQSSGLCACKSSFYLSGTCLPCDSSCLTCLSPSTCLTCSAPNSEIQLSGLCACKPRFYLSSTCLPCNSLCNTCLDFTSCLDCTDSNMVIGSKGLCECITGYYYDQTQMNCQKCIEGCNKCNDGLLCTECNDSNTYGPMCLFCNEKCLTCSGGTMFDCLTCGDEYLLNGFCTEMCPLAFKQLNGTCEMESNTGKILEYNFEGNYYEFYDLINNFIAIEWAINGTEN